MIVVQGIFNILRNEHWNVRKILNLIRAWLKDVDMRNQLRDCLTRLEESVCGLDQCGGT